MLEIRMKKWKKMSTKLPINIYNKPALVSIPLISQADDNITLLVKKGEYVYKGSIIARRKGNQRIPIHASVSGTVIGFEEKTYLDGRIIKCVVIQNDFKEKYQENNGGKKNIADYTKAEFIETLKECGIVGLDGSGFPTYIKYSGRKKLQTLIVNALETEPYVTADFALTLEKCEEILETIDAIMEINHIPEAYIAVKKNNTALINVLNNFIGTYLKIKLVLVPDFYTLGYEKNLVKYITGKSYQKYPINIGIIVNNISTIYAMYEALKYNHPLTERVVTFTGDALKSPQNVWVKLGTSTKEVIDAIGGYQKNKNLVFIAGGALMGTSLATDDLAITPNLTCVLVLKNNTKKQVVESCIRCGKCVEFCPVKLSPVLIKEAIDQEKMRQKLQPERCIGCGLCSYICPAKINLRKFVKEAKIKNSKEG